MTVWTNQSLRELERSSIAAFLNSNRHLLTGRVLDYGAGLQPYKPIVESAGGSYVPFDRAEFPANVSGADVGPDETEWGDIDTILFTQCAQYVADLGELFAAFRDLLLGGEPGVLVATGPTCWPIVEQEDLHRWTPAGVRMLLRDAGYRKACVSVRAEVNVNDLVFPIGWQAVAHA